jgi:Na+/proline symporter
VSAIDWAVLAATLAFFVVYGVWRGRGQHDLPGYLLANRSMAWPMVALSIMATQASAITFLSTPGQAFTDGMRFVQFYFGLPLAMIALCVVALPIYHRLGVYTAYEYLERRFDGKTRSLASALFLIQRGLATGLTIYAPSLVFSVLLGVDVRIVCLVLGSAVVIYTATGGAKAVSYTQVLQFSIILGTMALAFVLVLRALPPGVGLAEAATLAGRAGRLNAIDLSFDLQNRYSLWSGLIGGFFLQLSYFGADQSQVGRYLTGQSVAQSRMGLLFNGLVKVPMQFAILFLGAIVFVFYLFVAPPPFFNPVESARLANGPHAGAYRAIEARHGDAVGERRATAEALLEARRRGDAAAVAAADRAFDAAQARVSAVRGETVALLKRNDPAAPTSDTNYVFLRLVLGHLPVGIVGLVLAAIFAASMNSVAAELSALASTSVVDVVQRLPGRVAAVGRQVWVSRVATLFWGAFAILFAEYASRLGSLVEAVNILGSLFYGTILGIFLTAFLLRGVGGTAVFLAAIVAEAAVVACWAATPISFLWYNVVGCLAVMIVAPLVQAVLGRRTAVTS